MTVVNMHEAKSQLSRLVARAEAGEEVVIARDGRPAVRLTPVRAASTWACRVEGMWRGQVRISDDFDAPIPDFEAAFYDGPLEP
ncbi:MAG: type II toxin-antitoxin system Phd/YefM family antitoxin [Mycobacteriales bacterium]